MQTTLVNTVTARVPPTAMTGPTTRSKLRASTKNNNIFFCLSVLPYKIHMEQRHFEIKIKIK